MIYTEDTLVDPPAIKLYSEIKWKTVECWGEPFGSESPFGRNNRGDVSIHNRRSPVLNTSLEPSA